jgi:membrane protease YdiL (CAAX protease family)
VAGLLLTCVWCLLLLGGALRLPLAATYLACCALLLWARPRGGARPAVGPALLAGAAGFAALPAWLAAIAWLGLALGLPPAPAPAGAAHPGDALAHAALAPLFEELLYRERLLPALRARAGAPLALVLSSAVFAAPHGGAWSVLAAFCVGLALGGVFLAARRVEPCVGLHAGLNAAALACGLPPAGALPPPAAALAGCALLACAVAWTRVHETAARAR